MPNKHLYVTKLKFSFSDMASLIRPRPSQESKQKKVTNISSQVWLKYWKHPTQDRIKNVLSNSAVRLHRTTLTAVIYPPNDTQRHKIRTEVTLQDGDAVTTDIPLNIPFCCLFRHLMIITFENLTFYKCWLLTSWVTELTQEFLHFQNSYLGEQ